MSEFGREYFEARMRGLNCAVNLHRYKTGRGEYRSKTIEVVWETWREAWSRASYEGRKLSAEGRRIAYAEGLKNGAATLSPNRPAEGTNGDAHGR